MRRLLVVVGLVLAFGSWGCGGDDATRVGGTSGLGGAGGSAAAGGVAGQGGEAKGGQGGVGGGGGSSCGCVVDGVCYPAADPHCDQPLDVTYPWFVFHDWTSTIDTAGYSALEQALIAQAGVGIWPIFRAMNDDGAAQIAAIRAHNAEFVSTCVYSVMSRPANEPWAGRPLHHRLWEIFEQHPARHLDGTIIRAWPDPSQPVTAIWHSTLPAEGGYPYNRALLVELLDTIEQYVNQYPETCQGMWHDYYTSGGPYIWPAELSAHGAADLDQDGVAFADDPDEVTSWLEWEREFSRQLTARFGSAFVQFPNGRAVYPGTPAADEQLGRLVHGAVFEGYPNLPWYDPAESAYQLHQMYEAGWMGIARGHHWNLLWARPTHTAEQFEACRVSSMVFLTPYTRGSASGQLTFEDPHGITAGLPLGALDVSTVGTVTTYERAFEHGVARIVADESAGTLTPSWTPN